MSAAFVCHIEWGSSQPEALRKYLGQLFGWEFRAFAPGYLMYLPEDSGVSVEIIQSEQMRPGCSPNASVRVSDLDAMLAKATEPGGTIVVPKTPVGGGAFAFITAPDGNLIGM